MSRLTVQLALLVACSCAFAAPSFVWITDAHIGSSEGNAGAQLLTRSLPALTPRPQFVVVTGDCTEFGAEAHFDRYRRLIADLGLPVFSVPGNHDTTWAPKSRWEDIIGPRHFSVPCGDIHVVGIDSTLDMRGEGHIDLAERAWLRGTLAALPPGRPVILCWHQPLAGGNSLDYGSEAFIVDALTRYPVVAVLQGHNHNDSQQTIAGVPCFVSQSTWDGKNACANIVTVEPSQVRFEKLRLRDGVRKQFAHVDLPPAPRQPAVRLLTPGSDPIAGVIEVAVAAPDATATGKCKLGGGDFVPMSRTGDQLHATLPRPDLPGRQMLVVTVAHGDSVDWLFREITSADPDSGEVWRFAADSEIRCTPLATDGKLIFADAAGEAIALDAATGRRLWRTQVGGSVRGPVVRVGGDAVLATSAGRVCSLRLGDGKLTAVSLGSPATTGLALAGGRICVGTLAGEVICIEGSRTLWRAPTGYLLDAAPLTSGGVVYAANWHNAVVALDLATGRELWRAKVGRNEYYSPAAATPALLGGSLFLVSPDASLYVLDARTGVQRQKLPADAYSALAGGPTAIYVRSLKATLDAYDAAGKRLWSAPAAWGWDHSPSSPCISGDTVYAAGKRGSIEAYRASDGERLWGYRVTGDKVFSSPTCDAERVYCGTLNGDIVALRR